MATIKDLNLSDEELQYLVNADVQHTPDTRKPWNPSRIRDEFVSEANSLIDTTNSARAGLTAGLGNLKDKSISWTGDILESLGLTSAEDNRKVQQDITKDIAERKRTLGNTARPGFAKAGEFVGEYVPLFALPGSTLARAVLSGAVSGALDSRDDRTTGALIGGGAALTLGALAHGFRGTLPERLTNKEEAFKHLGLSGTRKQLIGKMTKKADETHIQQKVSELMPDGELSSYVDDFKSLLAGREEQGRRITDKLMTKVFEGPIGKQSYKFDDLKSSYAGQREWLLQQENSSVNAFVKELDGFFAQERITLADLNAVTRYNSTLKQHIETLNRKSLFAARDRAKMIMKEMTGTLEQRVGELSPRALERAKRATAVAKKNISEIRDPDLAKAITEGDFSSLLTALKRPIGKDTLATVRNALGPKGDEILRAGILKNAFEDSFTNFVFNPAKFAASLLKAEKRSGLQLGADTRKAADAIKEVMESLTLSPKTRFAGAGEIGGGQTGALLTGAKIVLESLLDSKVGLTLLTKAARGSKADVTANRIISEIVKAAGIAANPAADPYREHRTNVQDMSDEELQYILGQGQN